MFVVLLLEEKANYRFRVRIAGWREGGDGGTGGGNGVGEGDDGGNGGGGSGGGDGAVLVGEASEGEGRKLQGRMERVVENLLLIQG